MTKHNIPEIYIEILINLIQKQNKQIADIIFKQEKLKHRIVVPSRSELKHSIIYGKLSSESEPSLSLSLLE
jgi:hypothetical protein